MKLNKSLSVFSASTILLFTSSAYAATLTEDSYTETEQSFAWNVIWDGELPTSNQSLYLNTSSSLSLWSSQLGIDSGGLYFLGQHNKGPHQTDFNPGESAPIGLPNRINVSGNPPLSPTILAKVLTLHQHNPEPHYDSYAIAYNSVSNGNVIFQINGVHLAVPEPITTLLGSGLAFGFGGLLKREYSRKQKKLKDKEII
jgi:hypothetical protein